MSKSFFIFNLRIARVENNLNCRCKVRRYKNNNYVTYTKLYYCWICWWPGSISFRGLAVILFCVYFYAWRLSQHHVRIQRGIGGPDPPPPLENHKLYSQVIWVSYKTFYRDPPPPPPGKCWTPSESFDN